MWSAGRCVAAGDTVIIYLTRDLIQPLHIQPGATFNTKFGNYKHDHFIGVPYGSKVPVPSGRGFVYLLRPTPELWTLALPHRTQILYLADISFITSYLNIRSGSKVIEAGTGSASFSHSVARTIGSTGKLWSYEYHELRYSKAKLEFTQHGMDDVVFIQHRDVCKDGFTVTDEVDAVFLDLPAPWEAIGHAKNALRKDKISRICCFSPCIEQVLRTVGALNDSGFSEITTYETLLRPIEVFQIPAPIHISTVSEKIKQSERKREDKRQRQLKENREREEKKRRKELAIAEGSVSTVGVKRKDEEDGGEDGHVDKRAKSALDDSEVQDEGEGREEGMEAAVLSLDQVENSHDGEEGNPMDVDTTPTMSSSTPAPRLEPIGPPRKINLGKALPEVRGHTSYLTFAVLVPRPTITGMGVAESGSTTTNGHAGDKAGVEDDSAQASG